MNDWPYHLYRAEQVRELDRRAIENHGIAADRLMERAGRAAFAQLTARWPEAARIAVMCGTGNNGGDGYVLARLAREGGKGVELFQVGDGARLQGAARRAADAAIAAGLSPRPFSGESLGEYDLIVDGLLGTGLAGEVTGTWREAIERINDSGRPVLALDIPSGLHADTGTVCGAAVRAALTLTFIAMKPGLLTGSGPQFRGTLHFDDLGVPPTVYEGLVPAARCLSVAGFTEFLRPRRRDAHKGDFGHVLVIGGESGFAGAPRMAGEAAARVGSGLVSLAVRRESLAAVAAGRPELMCHAVEERAALAPLLRRASVVAVGPGLGRGGWGRAMLAAALESRLPLVVDADALSLLAEEPARRENWVLTPHPGEAARLLRCEVGQIQADRFAAAAGIEASFGGVTVLKGAGSVVQSGARPPGVCAAGNPGMASGGTGDLLTGVIAGLLAQGLGLAEAAELGVCLHAAAADAAAPEGERGMLATDLLPHLRRLVNPPR